MVKFIVNGQRGSKNILISIGLTLILISLLVFLYPKLFAYVFAAIVGLLGLGALIRGITARPPREGKSPYNGQGHTEDGSYQEVDD